MITPKEFEAGWRVVTADYEYSRHNRNNPQIAADRIVEHLGKDKALKVFAVFCRIKKGDGRLCHRDRLPEVDIPDITPYRECMGLGDIHSTHVDQIILEITK